MYNNTDSDEILIEKVKSGECDAFNPLVERYKLPLYKLMYRMVYNRDDTEDLVEEAFIKAYRSIAKFQTGKPFYAWLARIAINNALNFLKKERHANIQPIEWFENSLQSSQGNPVKITKQNMLEERISVAMKKLPEEYRTILLLRVEEDFSYDEISEVLNIPRGTVMSRLARARQRLKEIFKEIGVHKT